MPTPQREPLRKLSRSERTALERIGRRNNERVDVVRRANALLAVARTGVFSHAAREAGLYSGTTVADLVARFNRHGVAALRIATGRGRRATYSARACPHSRHSSAPTEPTYGWDGHLVLEHPAAELAASGLGTGRHQHDSARAARCWQFVSADTHLVSDRHRPTQAQVRRGDGGRPEHRGKKGLIDLAYLRRGTTGKKIDSSQPSQQLTSAVESYSIGGSRHHLRNSVP